MINTVRHLAYKLKSSEKELFAIINNIDDHYTYKQVPKTKYGAFQFEHNDIRMRDLYITYGPLKRIQQNINLLLQKTQLPYYAFGSVKGKNNILNAREHIGNKHFLSVDLKDFFTNIRHRQVFQMFIREKFSPTTARILTQLTTYQGKLQQGPPSSPIISNLVFLDTGYLLQDLARAYNITFTTYLDDLQFSSKKDFKPLIHDILTIVKAGSFYLHHKKIKYQTKDPEVTGVMVRKNKVEPHKKIIQKAKGNPYMSGYMKNFDNYCSY